MNSPKPEPPLLLDADALAQRTPRTPPGARLGPAVHEPARPTAADSAAGLSDSLVDIEINERTFGIRAADIESQRNSASMLINKMYGWRGYAGEHKIEHNPNRITLTAANSEHTIGTVTLGIDSPVGLLADELFKPELDAMRLKGARLCEIIKLAFETENRSPMALAALFHVLFIYAYHVHKCTDAFIEVNPRHRRYYERMLGFECMGELKMNPRVMAPAYLLHLNLDQMSANIASMGGKSQQASEFRSLYPYFFSKREEAGIIQRLQQIG